MSIRALVSRQAFAAGKNHRAFALRPLKTISLMASVSLLLACSDSVTTPVAVSAVADTAARDLFGLGGYWAMAQGINDFGRVVGAASDERGRSHAFVWSELGGIRDLGTLGGSMSAATAINNNSQIVGWATTASENAHAFLITAGQPVMKDLGVPAQGLASWANDIADDGTVVGQWLTGAGESRAFIWTATLGMQDLPAPPSLGALQATAINSRGDIVGFGAAVETGAVHALLWRPNSSVVDLGTLPGGSESIAWAINSGGDVVGATRRGEEPEHAFRWTAQDGMRDLGVLPHMDWSVARDISDNGIIVGYSGQTGSSIGRAFVWSAAGGMKDLGGLTAGVSDATGAFAINWYARAVGFSWNGVRFSPVIFGPVR